MDIRNIIETIEQSDIDRAEQHVSAMQDEQANDRYNMLAFAE